MAGHTQTAAAEAQAQGAAEESFVASSAALLIAAAGVGRQHASSSGELGSDGRHRQRLDAVLPCPSLRKAASILHLSSTSAAARGTAHSFSTRPGLLRRSGRGRVPHSSPTARIAAPPLAASIPRHRSNSSHHLPDPSLTLRPCSSFFLSFLFPSRHVSLFQWSSKTPPKAH